MKLLTPRCNKAKFHLLAAVATLGLGAHYTSGQAQNKGSGHTASLPLLNLNSLPTRPTGPVKNRRLEIRLSYARLSPQMKSLAFWPAAQDSQGNYVAPSDAIKATVQGDFQPGQTYYELSPDCRLSRARRRTSQNGPWIREDVANLRLNIDYWQAEFNSARQFWVVLDPDLRKSGEWELEGTLSLSLWSRDGREQFTGATQFKSSFYEAETPPHTSARYVWLPEKIPPMLRKIQWRLPATSEWMDAPKPGQPGSPIKIDSQDYVELRAVNLKSGIDWPRSPTQFGGGHLPLWRVDMNGKVSEDTTGFEDGEKRLNIPDSKRPYLATVRATAGNSIEVQFLMNAEKRYLPQTPVSTGPSAPKKWVVHLEYGINEVNTLKRAPLIGEPGFPLRIPHNSRVYFRPVYVPFSAAEAAKPGGKVVGKRPEQYTWSRDGGRTSDNPITEPGEFLLMDLRDSSEQRDASIGDIAMVQYDTGHSTGPLLETRIQVIPDKPGMPSPTPIPLLKALPLQISEYNKNQWRTVPLPGQPGYPLAVMENHSYQVRLPLNHSADWEMYKTRLGYHWPEWAHGFAEKHGTDPVTFQVSFHPDRRSKNTGDLYHLEVDWIQPVRTAFRVTPDYEAEAERRKQKLSETQTKIQVLRSQLRVSIQPASGSTLLSAQILALKRYRTTMSRAKVEVWGLDRDLDARWGIRLLARHANGQPAGQVNGPGTQDDFLARVGDSHAMGTLETDDIPGAVTVFAQVLGTHGEVLATSAPATVQFDELKFSIRYGGWRASDGRPMTWQREVTPLVEWKSSPIYGTSIAVMPVTLRLLAPDSTSLKSVSLSKKTTTTWERPSNGTASGQDRIQQYWTWSPNASRDLSAYPVEVEWNKPAVKAIATGGAP